MLINQGLEAKKKNYQQGKGLESGRFDGVIFNRTKDVLGGKARICITGQAPISKEILDFLKICFCADIINGYGMTETAGAATSAILTDIESGHVGGPLSNTMVRLKDLPELGYLTSSNPPRGEICFKGASISDGYFNDPEQTSQSFEDGWLLSGDVGEINSDGKITIIDRAKNIFKLDHGDYIAPEKVESVFQLSEWVHQSWVYGDTLKDYVLAFIVVDKSKLEEYAGQVGQSVEKVLEDADLKQKVLNSVCRVADENNLFSKEKPKQIQLLSEEFSTANGLLTATQKIDRVALKKKFAGQIDSLYSKRAMIAKKN